MEILAIKAVNDVEEFICKTKIICGSGGAAALKTLNSKRLFLVTDPFFEKNGTASRIAAVSGAAQSKLYSQVQPDPTVEQAAKGAAAIKEFQPDTVVALGGGSAMDLCKAMVFFSGLAVNFAAIPTTSGSGSEVTDFAILTHNGVKHPLIDEKLCPDMAILDSDFLKELPKGLIADTGFDVLSHALEAYAATGSSAITDALARDAFTCGMTVLPRSYGGDVAVRQKMHTASTMAGLAFTRAGLGLCHAMSHALGGMLHLPHGRLNAILLPVVLEVNRVAVGAKYADLARAAGFAGTADTIAVRNLKNALIRLRRSLGLPENLIQAGIDARDVRRLSEKICKAAAADPCAATNPVPVTEALACQVLNEVTGNG